MGGGGGGGVVGEGDSVGADRMFQRVIIAYGPISDLASLDCHFH